MVCTLLAGVNVVAFAADDLVVSVHSFYNDAEKGGDGEHLFTKDADEMSWLSSLPTWNDENEAWKAPVSSSLAIYRCYNPNSGEHHYAAADEASWLVGQGWTQEKLAFYSDDNMGVPVYRLWNGLDGVGSHYYTTNEGEAAFLASIGWTAEGVNFYGVKGEDKAMSAAQTGANEITVTSVVGEFTGLELFSVSHGDLVDELADLEYDEEEDAYVITLANPIVDAVYTVSCSDTDFAPVTFQGEESEEFEITAMQTKANEATILSTRAITALDDVDVLRDDNEVDGTVSISEDGKTITFTTDSAFAADEYTVIVTPAEEGVAPAMTTFEAEASKLVAISFVGDNLVLTQAGDFTRAAAAIRGFNQFGEPQVLEQGMVKCYSAYTDGDGTEYSQAAGGVVMFSTTGSQIFTVGQTVPATATYQNGTTVLQTTANLVVSDAQVISSFEFGDIATENVNYMLEDVTHEGLTNANYYMPVTAKDQYGNTFTAAQLNALAANDLLIVTPNTASSYAYVDQHNNPFDTLDDGTVVVRFKEGNLQIPGTAVFSFVSVGGTTASTSFEIEDSRFIAGLEVAVPELYVGVESELSLTAVDQNGDEFTPEELYKLWTKGTVGPAAVAVPTHPLGSATGSSIRFGDYNSLTQQGTTITVSSGTLDVHVNHVKKTITVCFEPAANGATVPANMVITTAAPYVTYMTLTANAEGKPAGIKGLKSTVNTVLGGNNAEVDLKSVGNVVFTDTYGNVMPSYAAPRFYANGAVTPTGTQLAPEYFYKVALKDAETGATAKYTTEGPAGIYTAQLDNQGKRKAGSDTYVVTLYSNDGTRDTAVATKSVKITQSDEKYVAYQAGFGNALTEGVKSNLYTGVQTLTGGNLVGDLAVLKVYGIDSAYNVVELGDQGEFTARLRNNTVGTAEIEAVDLTNPPTEATTGSHIGVVVTSAEQSLDDVTGKAYMDIYALNAEGTQTVLVATAELATSNEEPETLAIVGTKDGEMIDLSKGISLVNQTAAGTYVLRDHMPIVMNPITRQPVKQFTGDAVLIIDGLSAYTIFAQDQYGMSNMENVTFNGHNFAVTDGPGQVYPTAEGVYVGGTLVVASDDISSLVTITQK